MLNEDKNLIISRNSSSKNQLGAGYLSDSEGLAYDTDDSASSHSEQEGGKIPLENTEDNVGEDDMFASEGEEPQPQNWEKKSKNEFDIAQFERDQGLEDYKLEAESGSRNVAADSSVFSSRPEIELEAFDLREEAESGKFDKDMNYIKKDNSDSGEDEPWMVETTAADIQKARDAKRQNSSKSREDLSAIERPILEILPDLILELEPAETPMEALVRLRPVKKKNLKRLTIHKDTSRKNSVFKITDCCEQLVNEKGISGAYDMSREELMRAYALETGRDIQGRGIKRGATEMENGDVQYGEAIWEFRWNGEAEIHGPYSSYEMKHWKDTYFEDNVEVSRAGGSGFQPVVDVVFDNWQ